mmetsp:Transcript_39850/g.105661  ORF Transcript_39850/g.105661 Transcript_39850/m.105661 type:complete len:416 (-) Transcript_39850:388-1635(-)
MEHEALPCFELHQFLQSIVQCVLRQVSVPERPAQKAAHQHPVQDRRGHLQLLLGNVFWDHQLQPAHVQMQRPHNRADIAEHECDLGCRSHVLYLLLRVEREHCLCALADFDYVGVVVEHEQGPAPVASVVAHGEQERDPSGLEVAHERDEEAHERDEDSQSWVLGQNHTRHDVLVLHEEEPDTVHHHQIPFQRHSGGHVQQNVRVEDDSEHGGGDRGHVREKIEGKCGPHLKQECTVGEELADQRGSNVVFSAHNSAAHKLWHEGVVGRHVHHGIGKVRVQFRRTGPEPQTALDDLATSHPHVVIAACQEREHDAHCHAPVVLPPSGQHDGLVQHPCNNKKRNHGDEQLQRVCRRQERAQERCLQEEIQCDVEETALVAQHWVKQRVLVTPRPQCVDVQAKKRPVAARQRPAGAT